MSRWLWLRAFPLSPFLRHLPPRPSSHLFLVSIPAIVACSLPLQPPSFACPLRNPPVHPVLLLARLSSKRSRWHATAPSSKHLRQSLAVLKTVRGPQASSISIPWALDYSKASRAPPRLTDRALHFNEIPSASVLWSMAAPASSPSSSTQDSPLVPATEPDTQVRGSRVCTVEPQVDCKLLEGGEPAVSKCLAQGRAHRARPVDLVSLSRCGLCTHSFRHLLSTWQGPSLFRQWDGGPASRAEEKTHV